MSYPTLQTGARGPAVTSLQRALQQAGYALTADGSFGPQTKTAVLNFQRATGITTDGIVGPATWTALENALGATLNIPPASPPITMHGGSEPSTTPPAKSEGPGLGVVLAVVSVLAVGAIVVGKVFMSDDAEPEPPKARRKK